MVLINDEICIGCQACVKDCPAGVIHMTTEGKAENKRACIQCGHCVAVCPVEAVSIPEYEMSDVEEYNPETFSVNPESMLHAIKFRRSIRNFKPDKIEEVKIDRVLNAGRYTATAKNKQANTFIFIQKEMEEFRREVWSHIPATLEMLKKESPVYAKVFGSFYEKWKENPDNDNLLYNAPAFLVILTNNHSLDGGLAAANIENMAVAEGLGVLYSGYMMRVISESVPLRKWLGAGEKTIACCMLIGYPAVSYRRTAPRKPGKIIKR